MGGVLKPNKVKQIKTTYTESSDNFLSFIIHPFDCIVVALVRNFILSQGMNDQFINAVTGIYSDFYFI